MTKLEFTCSDEKSVFLLRAARLYDEGVKLEPVRHGQWIPIMHHDVFGKEFVSHHKCSVCEGDALYECANYDAEEELSNYCPNCGAKMDAEVNGDA